MSNYESIPVSNDRIVDEAARAPVTLFEYSASNPTDSERAPGLILTKEQLKNIKRYEVTGLALPIELNNVINYLGYTTGADRGLEAVDFQSTFKLIHTHASSWNPLRVDLISVGHKLQLFAGEMEIHDETMKDIRNDIRAFNIRTAEDVRRFETDRGDQFVGIEIDASDMTTLREVDYYLKRIIESIKQQEADANGIKVRLDAFASTLSLQVRPALQLKLRLIDNNTLSDEIKVLNDIIEQRAKDIDEKTKEYNDAVKDSLGHASKFTLPSLAMAIYVGVEAERIRKERNALRGEQIRDIAAMQTKNRILGSLNRVRLDLQDLDLIVIDADIATKNLVTVWNKLHYYAEASLQKVELVNDAETARQFFNAFAQVATPWTTIKKDANILLTVFAQADTEFVQEYQNSINRFGLGA